MLLKCTNDQPRADVEAQVAALLFFRRAAAAPPTCYPVPLACCRDDLSNPASYVSMSTGSPSIVLDFLPGRPADKVLTTGGAAVADKVLFGTAAALARLHSVPLPPDAELAVAGLRDAGGPGRYPGRDPAAACFVGMQPRLVVEFAAEPKVAGHPFLPLHSEQVPALVATMQADVPRGFVHGDPFLDNALALDSGEVVGWVDWEDVAVGPVMFDVGCAIIGCCYRSAEGEDNGLDYGRLTAFLRGYQSVRPLEPGELAAVVPFMRVALLCNATWRFRNFNIVHEVPEAKDSYKELADRLVELKSAAVAAAVAVAVAECSPPAAE